MGMGKYGLEVDKYVGKKVEQARKAEKNKEYKKAGDRKREAYHAVKTLVVQERYIVNHLILQMNYYVNLRSITCEVN